MVLGRRRLLIPGGQHPHHDRYQRPRTPAGGNLLCAFCRTDKCRSFKRKYTT
ncbi:hypothetical protein L210DRAFT_3532815 [Boletus edulis BED1]|uniref:Uncharacterized protein n=1 Tax=Boletus edulis BED1 TaxID=1328754 RepID=A0AAD4BZ93_BOLED|nr:hypothetical protein L210DRAFT_3532815 [Boletus edulis BED1]